MVSPIWFWAPNLIGYVRIISAIFAFQVAFDDYVSFFIFYSISALLDMADGYAARALNQCSKFGAVLDMITDRASTTCLQVILSLFYPKYVIWYCFLMALDIVSHYSHMYSSLSNHQTSHKIISQDKPKLLQIYYGNRFVLGFLCWGNEAFFLFLYLFHFWSGPLIPIGPLGPLANILFSRDFQGSMELLRFLTFFAAGPIMFVKQFINGVQWWQACVDMIALDEQDRRSKSN